MARRIDRRLFAGLALFTILLALVLVTSTAHAQEGVPPSQQEESYENPTAAAAAPEYVEVVPEAEVEASVEVVEEIQQPAEELQQRDEQQQQQQQQQQEEQQAQETYYEPPQELPNEEQPVVVEEFYGEPVQQQQQQHEEHQEQQQQQEEQPATVEVVEEIIEEPVQQQQHQEEQPAVVEVVEEIIEEFREEPVQQQHQEQPAAVETVEEIIEEPAQQQQHQEEQPAVVETVEEIIEEPVQQQQRQHEAEPFAADPEPEQTPPPVLEESDAYKPQIVPEHGEAPEIREGGASVRWQAKSLPEGCVKGVESYLKHIHEGRRATANAVTEARARLNEARLHQPEQVSEAEEAFAAATAKLVAYDAESIHKYGGDLPKTCLDEVASYLDSLPEVTSESDFIQFYAHFYRVLNGHARVFVKLCLGEVEYIKNSYAPMFVHFNKFADTYYAKAKVHFDAAHPKPGLLDKITGKQKEVPTVEFVKNVAQGAAYACVPLMVTVAAAVICSAFLPVLVAAFVVPDVMYSIYIKLFVFYYTYGMTFPADFVATLKATVAKLQAKQWASVANTAIDAFFDIAGDNYGFYNGILMVSTMVTAAVVLFVVMFIWIHCCCFRRGERKTASKPEKQPASAKTQAAAAKKKN